MKYVGGVRRTLKDGGTWAGIVGLQRFWRECGGLWRIGRVQVVGLVQGFREESSGEFQRMPDVRRRMGGLWRFWPKCREAWGEGRVVAIVGEWRWWWNECEGVGGFSRSAERRSGMGAAEVFGKVEKGVEDLEGCGGCGRSVQE